MKISILKNTIKVGKDFVLKCRIVRPKSNTAPVRYSFSIEPVVKRGKKFRTYSSQSFPGTVKANFVEVK